MRQFILGSQRAFEELEARARHSCVVFRDEEMPPGSTPAAARIGFEVRATDGRAILFVEHGVHYSGGLESVNAWLASGSAEFRDFEALREWIKGDLALAYRPPNSDMDEPAPSPRDPAALTDLAAVASAQRHDQPNELGEDTIRQRLLARIRGQDAALSILSRRLVRHLGKSQPKRPLTLFFVGPTGVGKTKTAETIAAILSSTVSERERYGYLRLDMSEYSERHRVSQMLGAPPGYIGYGDGAGLVDRLTASPRSVILFDEIEKAHPDCVRALMNAMDAGRLSTSSSADQARQVDCRQAIFVFTSNIDCSRILRDAEDCDAFEDAAVVDSICRTRLVAAGIQPELVGRIGAFLLFRPLSEAARAEIAALGIVDAGHEYGVDVCWIDPSLLSFVLSRSSGVAFGARPDRNVIEDVMGQAFAAYVDRQTADREQPRVHVIGPPVRCIPKPSDDRRAES